MTLLQCVLLILTVIGTLYYIFSTLALAWHFSRPKRVFTPSDAKISVLKPICGVDAELESNLESYFRQDYPDYEILLGVLENNDRALPILSQFTEAKLYIGSDIDGSNSKVRVLHNLAKQSTGDILVITDADTRVSPNFLRAITSPFADPQVGAVTCLYRGDGASTVASSLEALHMTCIFAPGVASHNVIGIDFGLGAAIAVRRSALEKTGGFAELADYLADDFQLGRMISKAGYKVILSNYVIDITLGSENLITVLRRELRWSVTTRVSRPLGNLGLVFTFGSTYALAFLIASGFSNLSWMVLIFVMLIRLATAWLGARVCLIDRGFPRAVVLLPLRDLLSFAIWAASYFTQSVNWRGRKLKVRKNGKMKAE